MCKILFLLAAPCTTIFEFEGVVTVIELYCFRISYSARNLVVAMKKYLQLRANE